MIIGHTNKGKRHAIQVSEALIWAVRALGVAFYVQTLCAEISSCSSHNPKRAAEKQHQYLFPALCSKPDLLSWRMCGIHHLPAPPLAPSKYSLLHPMNHLLSSTAGTCRCTENTLAKAAPQAVRCRIFLSGAEKQACGSTDRLDMLRQPPVPGNIGVLFSKNACRHFPTDTVVVCIPQRGRSKPLWAPGAHVQHGGMIWPALGHLWAALSSKHRFFVLTSWCSSFLLQIPGVEPGRLDCTPRTCT